MKKKEYYIEKYEKLVKEATKEADNHYDALCISKEKRDYGEWISEFEAESNTDEVVGYYLETYPDDYLPMWEENTEGIELSKQDKSVYATLKSLWRTK